MFPTIIDSISGSTKNEVNKKKNIGRSGNGTSTASTPLKQGNLKREKSRRTKTDENIPRMMDIISSSSSEEEDLNDTVIARRETKQPNKQLKIQEMETEARANTMQNPLLLFLYNGYSAFRIFETYLVTIGSLVGIVATVAATLCCYYYAPNSSSEASMSWMILSITIVNPLSTSLGMSFFRRERSTRFVTTFRAYALQIYLGHALFAWDPTEKGDARWRMHSDEILSELVGIGDELCRFLTLPTCTLSQHRLTKVGHREAATTMEVSYRLFNSLLVHRLVRLSMLAEEISEELSLSDSDALRLRQIERQFSVAIESLRMVKMYRTPLALRAFARVFTVLLPPFYGPNLAKIAIQSGSLPFAVCFAVMTSLALTSLYNAVQIMEDPFVAYTTLDGIDCREELSVLHWHQLVNARKLVYPDAPPFPKHRVDEDGHNPHVKAVEGSVRCDSFILGESKREELSIRESAYAAMPMDGDDDNIIDFTRSRLQSFDNLLRNRATTGTSQKSLAASARRRSSTLNDSMLPVSIPSISSQSPVDIQEEENNYQLNTSKRRSITDSSAIINEMNNYDYDHDTPIFGERTRFPDAVYNNNDTCDKSNRTIPDINEQQQQQKFTDYNNPIDNIRSRFYSNDASSLTRIRLESFDQNAFSNFDNNNTDIENPSFDGSINDNYEKRSLQQDILSLRNRS